MNLRKTKLTASAVVALLAASASAAHAQSGGVLLSGYAPSGVSEETVLGTGKASRTATAPSQRELVAAIRSAKPVAQRQLSSRGSSASPGASSTGRASRHGNHKTAHSAPAVQSRVTEQARPAVLAAAERSRGPIDGSWELMAFGAALVALAGGSAALWRRKGH